MSVSFHGPAADSGARRRCARGPRRPRNRRGQPPDFARDRGACGWRARLPSSRPAGRPLQRQAPGPESAATGIAVNESFFVAVITATSVAVIKATSVAVIKAMPVAVIKATSVAVIKATSVAVIKAMPVAVITATGR